MFMREILLSKREALAFMFTAGDGGWSREKREALAAIARASMSNC
jgi:hypothetical protein